MANRQWLREHRELQYLRSAAAVVKRRRRRPRRGRGIAVASAAEQAAYLEERARKLRRAR